MMFVCVYTERVGGAGGGRGLKKENTVFPPSFSVSKVFEAG